MSFYDVKYAKESSRVLFLFLQLWESFYLNLFASQLHYSADETTTPWLVVRYYDV